MIKSTAYLRVLKRRVIRSDVDNGYNYALVPMYYLTVLSLFNILTNFIFLVANVFEELNFQVKLFL